MAVHADNDLKATILLEALYTTDGLTARKYGVTERTLGNYRQQLATDPELQSIFATRKNLLDSKWAETLNPVLITGIRTLGECLKAIAGDTEAMKNPQVIHAITGAVKICAEVQITGKFIDSRIEADRRNAGTGKSNNAESGLSGSEPEDRETGLDRPN